MSRIQIIGEGLSGKSTLAAHVAKLLAKLRKHEDVPVVILTAPTTSYTPYGLEIHRTRTMAGVLRHLKGVTGPLILDDRSELYALLVESWREQTSTYRDRAGLPRKARIGPEEWQIINSKDRDVFRQCLQLGVDLVEIYRKGPVMVADGDFGMIDGEGVRARGQAEAASGGDLVLLLDGGLRSRFRETGTRVLRVISDVSGRLNGKELQLPRLSEKGDRARLDRDLAKFLTPSLVDAIAWSDLEASEWRNGTDPIDDWSEARDAAQRAESASVASRVSTLLEINGLGGQTGEVKKARAILLDTHFGVGHVDQFSEVPASRLRERMPDFEASVKVWNQAAA